MPAFDDHSPADGRAGAGSTARAEAVATGPDGATLSTTETAEAGPGAASAGASAMAFLGDAPAGAGGQPADPGSGWSVRIGGAADDRFAVEGARPAWIDGGAGRDTVVYDAPLARLEVERLPDGDVRIDRTGAEPDRLENVERAEFTDATLLFDIDSPFLATVYRFYLAAFGRTPDEDGLRFWLGEAERGPGIGTVADRFADSAEFRERIDWQDGPEQVVEVLYESVLGREADADGLAFWTDAFARRDHDAGEMLRLFAGSAEAEELAAGFLDDGVLVL